MVKIEVNVLLNIDIEDCKFKKIYFLEIEFIL